MFWPDEDGDGADESERRLDDAALESAPFRDGREWCMVSATCPKQHPGLWTPEEEELVITSLEQIAY